MTLNRIKFHLQWFSISYHFFKAWFSLFIWAFVQLAHIITFKDQNVIVVIFVLVAILLVLEDQWLECYKWNQGSTLVQNVDSLSLSQLCTSSKFIVARFMEDRLEGVKTINATCLLLEPKPIGFSECLL